MSVHKTLRRTPPKGNARRFASRAHHQGKMERKRQLKLAQAK